MSKIIIAGSRNMRLLGDMEQAIKACHFSDITEVVCGGARGADKLGEQWAKLNNIPVKYFYADWNKNGKQAGILRNLEMAKYADGLIALWDGESRGTKHMIEAMKKADKQCFVYIKKGKQNDETQSK